MNERYKKNERIFDWWNNRILVFSHTIKVNGKTIYNTLNEDGKKFTVTPNYARKLYEDENGLYWIRPNGWGKSYVTSKKFLYHGSTTRISQFKFTDRNKSDMAHGPGIYFTPDKKETLDYGNYVHTVSLKKGMKEVEGVVDWTEIKKLIGMSPMNFNPNWQSKLFTRTEPVDESYEEFKKKKYYTFGPDPTNKKIDLFQEVWIRFFHKNNEKYIEAVRSLGYDYFKKQRDSQSIVYVVFNPDMIKLVDVEKYTGTKGLFYALEQKKKWKKENKKIYHNKHNT